jgi:hypothetical protein
VATDYFNMMRDVVGGYGEGMDLKRARTKADAEEARRVTEFNNRQAEHQYQLDQRAKVDRSLGEFSDLASTGQAVGKNTSGMTDGSARMLFKEGGQQAVDDTASYANVENRRMGLAPSYNTSSGATPDAAPTPTVALRKADSLDYNQGLARVASAQKDVGSLTRLMAERPELEYKRGFTEHMAGFGKDPEAMDKTTGFINTNHRILTVGDEEKGGARQVSVVKPDGKSLFLKLSKAEQAKLYAAGQMMESHPEQALRDIAGINKDLALSLAADSGIDFKAAELGIRGFAAESADRYHTKMGNAADARAAGDREQPSETMNKKIEALATIIREADPAVTPEKARVMAANQLLRGQNGPKEPTEDAIQNTIAELRTMPDFKGKKMTPEMLSNLRSQAIGILKGDNGGGMPVVNPPVRPGAGPRKPTPEPGLPVDGGGSPFPLTLNGGGEPMVLPQPRAEAPRGIVAPVRSPASTPPGHPNGISPAAEADRLRVLNSEYVAAMQRGDIGTARAIYREAALVPRSTAAVTSPYQ